MAWLTGWQYRRAITIDNTANATTLTDYQLVIVIDTATLISAGKMNADGSDIRLTASDGTTLLYHWIEDGTINTTATRIWVKVPTIGASATETIYLYYGNTSAANTSSIQNTFISADDFNSSTLDAGWQVYQEANASYSLSGGLLSININVASTGIYLSMIRSEAINTNAEIVMKYESVSRGLYTFYSVNYETDLANWSAYPIVNKGYNFLNYEYGANDIVRLHRVDNGATTILSDNSSTYDPTAGYLVIRAENGAYQGEELDASSISLLKTPFVADATYTNPFYMRLSFRASSAASFAITINFVFTRQYTSNEPTITVGAEEVGIIFVDLAESISIGEDKANLILNTLATETLQLSEQHNILADQFVALETLQLSEDKLRDLAITKSEQVSITEQDLIQDIPTQQTENMQINEQITAEYVFKTKKIIEPVKYAEHSFIGPYYIRFSPYTSQAIIEKATERTVDMAKLILSPQAQIEAGDRIDIYTKNEQLIFSGTVEHRTKGNNIQATIMGKGYELNNIIVNKIYQNIAPEDIVKDLITNYTSLTYTSTATSGFILDKFVVTGFISEAIQKLAQLLDWQVRVDQYGNFYFEPRGYINNGRTLINGQNCKTKEVKEDPTSIINKIFLKGDDITYHTEQSFTGDGTTTEFILANKPVGTVKVLIDGVEQKGDEDYQVDKENKKIIFNTAPASGVIITVQYDYLVTIYIEMENTDSQQKYGVKAKKMEKKFIKSFADGRKYASRILDIYSEPLLTITAQIKGIDLSLSVGELVRYIDTIRGIDREMVINKIRYLYPAGVTELTLGILEYNFWDWQAEVQERIKQLEDKLSTEDIITKYHLFKMVLNSSINIIKLEVKKRKINSGAKWDNVNTKWDSGGLTKWGQYKAFTLDSTYAGGLDDPTNVLDAQPEVWETHYIEEQPEQ